VKFETILDMYDMVTLKLVFPAGGERQRDRHRRQRDAFRARLVKMYEELNYRKNWYRMPLGNEVEQASSWEWVE